MEAFKYFTRKDDNYVMKNQKGFNYIVGVCCVVAGICCIAIGLLKPFFNIQIFRGQVFIAVGLIIAGVFCLYHSKVVKMVIDPFSQTISFMSMYCKSSVVYSFDNFIGFQMLKIKRYGIFNINMLHMQFTEEDGTTKMRMVRQYGISTKKLQDFTDEIEQIMTVDMSFCG